MCKDTTVLLRVQVNPTRQACTTRRSFGGWGKHKHVPPQREGEGGEEDGDKSGDDDGDDVEVENKRNPDEMITDENGNVIIRGTDGKDHMIRPDLMKVLLISRGPKLNRRERRENWIKKRTILREEGKLPATPRPPPVPLRMVNRKYACGLRLQGISFYASVYCYPDRPGNYQFFLMAGCRDKTQPEGRQV